MTNYLTARRTNRIQGGLTSCSLVFQFYGCLVAPFADLYTGAVNGMTHCSVFEQLTGDQISLAAPQILLLHVGILNSPSPGQRQSSW